MDESCNKHVGTKFDTTKVISGGTCPRIILKCILNVYTAILSTHSDQVPDSITGRDFLFKYIWSTISFPVHWKLLGVWNVVSKWGRW